MNTGDNAWVLASSALVLLMTPGLAMFYGGMTRSKNVLSTMMHSFFLMGLASLIWMLWGFSFAFARDVFLGLSGGFDYLALVGVGPDVWAGTTIPTSTYVIFQCGFAVLTPALISGAFAERMRFGAFIAFMALWLTLVYCPICHWVWASDGWLSKLGALDFAGGTVVHINAGMTALACALLVGERKGYGEQAMLPHNLPVTLLGAGLLWIGWFGFNAGSALKADPRASMAFLVTHLAAAAASVSWLVSEWVLRGRPTTLGFASGAVAGLVAITPAAGYVNPAFAVVIGLVAGVLCYFAVLAKSSLGYDDSLDVVGIHAVGGAWGALATGLFASKAVGGVDGLVMGNAAQFFTQALAVAATGAYAFLASGAILLFLDTVMDVRAHEDEERRGMDISMHGESAYNL